MELSVVMPCLNEAETVEVCVRKALGFFAEHGVDGEVIIADNGSTDGSSSLLAMPGPASSPFPTGYGAALTGGIRSGPRPYIVMADADDCYDFTASDARSSSSFVTAPTSSWATGSRAGSPTAPCRRCTAIWATRC